MAVIGVAQNGGYVNITETLTAQARSRGGEYQYVICRECGRKFDLFNAIDTADWAYGHDCESALTAAGY